MRSLGIYNEFHARRWQIQPFCFITFTFTLTQKDFYFSVKTGFSVFCWLSCSQRMDFKRRLVQNETCLLWCLIMTPVSVSSQAIKWFHPSCLFESQFSQDGSSGGYETPRYQYTLMTTGALGSARNHVSHLSSNEWLDEAQQTGEPLSRFMWLIMRW